MDSKRYWLFLVYWIGTTYTHTLTLSIFIWGFWFYGRWIIGILFGYVRWAPCEERKVNMGSTSFTFDSQEREDAWMYVFLMSWQFLDIVLKKTFVIWLLLTIKVLTRLGFVFFPFILEGSPSTNSSVLFVGCLIYFFTLLVSYLFGVRFTKILQHPTFYIENRIKEKVL